MQTKIIVIACASVAVVVLILAMITVANRNAERTVASERSSQTVASPPPLVSQTSSPPTIAATDIKPEIQLTEGAGPPIGKSQGVVADAKRVTKTKEPIQDPIARAALSLVGADANAEEYWIAAINDPTLSKTERQDLIEDLNEDGLSDPKRPGPQDLPLILSRLELIEALAPYAMDQVNANAFAEAYKDLANLANGQTAQ